ncbi:hypothetical protein AZZ70_003174, partial [Klebsiella pneumoniae]
CRMAAYMPYPAYVPSCGLPPQDRQAQRRRAAGSGQLPQFTVRRRARSCG